MNEIHRSLKLRISCHYLYSSGWLKQLRGQWRLVLLVSVKRKEYNFSTSLVTLKKLNLLQRRTTQVCSSFRRCFILNRLLRYIYITLTIFEESFNSLEYRECLSELPSMLFPLPCHKSKVKMTVLCRHLRSVLWLVLIQ